MSIASKGHKPVKLFLQDRQYTPAVGAFLASRPQNKGNIFWYLTLTLLSTGYYLIFHGAANLHDVSHYIITGVSMARDHSNLIYPYSSMNPEGGGSAYGYFQENSHLVDLTKSYPSRLYSGLFAALYSLTGAMHFYYAHLISLIAIILSNLFIYAISVRFFTGLRQALFIICIAFTPIMSSVIYPSNDSIGYLVSVVILWACFCSRLSPLAIGLLVGALSHFRSQIIFFLIIVPFLLILISDKRYWLKIGTSIFFGGVASYLVVDSLLKLAIIATTASGGGLEFYLKFFLQSFYGPKDILIILQHALSNLANLDDKNFIYIFFFAGLIGLTEKEAPFQKSLILTAFFIIAFPLCIYSLDRYSPPHARYYIGSIPFFVLAWFLFMEKKTAISSNQLAIATTVTILLAWLSMYGFPYKNATSVTTIKNRVVFLEFNDAEKVLTENFTTNDLLITNHALPSGLAKLQNFIPYPSFDEFRHGDNHEIDGLVFVYSNEGVNAFFKPTDWMKNGQMPTEIRDDNGSVFKKISDEKSSYLNGNAITEDEANFVVYKNIDSARNKIYDNSGRRLYKVKNHEELSFLKTKSPRFEIPADWQGTPTFVGTDGAIIVGPGPNNSNILSQRFLVTPGEKLKISATVSSANKKTNSGRLQINWADQNEQFLKTDIAIFKVGQLKQQQRKIVIAPPNAKWGVVYVTPHEKNDVLEFYEMSVLGRSGDEK